MNRLINEKSAYLRHSAHQLIDWYPWSEEAFERAKKEDKPVFLSSGAIWCHWCHVMAEETFNNTEIIEFLNNNFICIKIDRDERPDIDRRMQMAVQTISGTGGWPLSVFLTPDGYPFFGGTYFPPEDAHGRAGFKRVLRTVIDFYKKNKEQLLEQSSRLMNLLSENKDVRGDIRSALIEIAKSSLISSFDPVHGGFGQAPKFPMPGVIEFVINRLFFEERENFLYKVLNSTLTAMAEGGIHDQLGGGFHRYATDEAWIIPHFEKMADDNAWLLRNYIDACRLTGSSYFKEVAEGIINFVRTTLSDPDGGFYASQDADVTPEDEGGAFTWSYDELKNVLDEQEFTVLTLHLLHERGSMPHDPSRKVLFVVKTPEEIGSLTGMNEKHVNEIIKRAKEKLLRYRKTRKQPFVDKNLYTSLNGMMITSFLKAGRYLNKKSCVDYALKTVRRILSLRYKDGQLYHSEDVKGMLEDYVYLIEALLLSYEVTADRDYLGKAIELMDSTTRLFYDTASGGFFDTEEPVLGIRLKTIEDIPHPSANSLAIIMLLKLFHLTDRNEYLKFAEDSLRTFSVRAKGNGIFSAYYFVALDMYFNMLRLSIHASKDSELSRTALTFFRPYVTLRYEEQDALSFYEEKDFILPCLRERCLEPIFDSKELVDFLKAKIKTEN